jgi:hypothetical protein
MLSYSEDPNLVVKVQPEVCIKVEDERTNREHSSGKPVAAVHIGSPRYIVSYSMI